MVTSLFSLFAYLSPAQKEDVREIQAKGLAVEYRAFRDKLQLSQERHSKKINVS
jgi:hypothetical protein